MTKKYVNLSQIIKKILFDKNMRVADLARAIEMPIPTVHRIVTGKSTRPFPSSLQAIAKYLGVNVAQLIGDEPLTTDIGSFPISKHAKIVPVIQWNEIDDYITGKRINATSDLVAINVSNKSFALTMPDYSMEPIFQKGSILIFDPQVSVIDRSYVLVKLQNSNTYLFKQLILDGHQRFIKSLNQDISAISVKALEREDKTIARLIESRHSLL